MSTTAFASSIPDDIASSVSYAYFSIAPEEDSLGPEENKGQSITLSSFREQIDEITNHNYSVRSVKDILEAQQKKQKLQAPTILLTFEKFDQNFVNNILPILQEKQLPALVFLSAASLEEADKSDTHPNWSDLQLIMHKNPQLEWGMVPYFYTHLINSTGSATDLTQNINRAKAIFIEKLGYSPSYFSYPYGEYSAFYRNIIAKQGFVAAFTYISGAMGPAGDPFLWPRFTMTDGFDDIERLRMTARSLPFPVYDVEPSQTYSVKNPPDLGFSVRQTVPRIDLKSLRCYASGMGKLEPQILSHRVEIRLPRAFEDTDGRVNCTIPVNTTSQEDTITNNNQGAYQESVPNFRWIGFQFNFVSREEK